ncbi:UNVERIFIED_CONTAM: hypothetical protein Sradi_5426600 [Sesamum radiatum]|uniref:Uncharacterized protein n=1 Tax=Sesamum radiatum TaxID=300843 RepID=A0AAW2L8W2_SESRA
MGWREYSSPARALRRELVIAAEQAPERGGASEGGRVVSARASEPGGALTARGTEPERRVVGREEQRLSGGARCGAVWS